jgi:hypothetical protein
MEYERLNYLTKLGIGFLSGAKKQREESPSESSGTHDKIPIAVVNSRYRCFFHFIPEVP